MEIQNKIIEGAKEIFNLASQGLEEAAVKNQLIQKGYSEGEYAQALQYLSEHMDELQGVAAQSTPASPAAVPAVDLGQARIDLDESLKKVKEAPQEAPPKVAAEPAPPAKEEPLEGVSASGLKYTVTGTTLPALQIHLEPGRTVYSEAGAMSWMTKNIKMDTQMKGFLKIFSRLLIRETLFVNQFKTEEGQGVIAFTPSLPGNIVALDLVDGREVIAQKDAWLCAEEGVEIRISLQAGIFRGLFGGEGFIMQKFHGKGAVFLEIDGSVIEKELKEGEFIYVDQGNIGAFEHTVKYRLTLIKGILNWFFSSEGLFITKLTGPGKVWLQTLPASQLSKRLRKAAGTLGLLTTVLIVGYVVVSIFFIIVDAV